MQRRQLLAITGAALGTSIAGCTGGDEDPEPTDDGDGGMGDDDTGDGMENDSGTDDGDDGDGGGGAAEDVSAVVGSLVEGDNLHLVVEDATHTTELGQFQEADQGNEFVVVDLALKNVSDDFVSVSNLLQTSLHDDEDYSYSQTYATTDGQAFNDGQFAPGEVERGEIVFEIPEDATGLELQFDFDVSIFGGIDRATVDLEDETSVHELQQELEIEIYDIGQTIEYQDVEVAVTDVRYETQLGQFTEADEGNEFAILDLEITNGTDEEQRISTVLQMLIKDGRGRSYQEDLGATVELDRAFNEADPLTPGETRRGEVAYQVEKELSPLYWVFEFDLWTDGDKTFWQLR